MCQSLVEKVAQSKQLMSITDPDLLVLFEDWLEELEAEVVSLSKTRSALKTDDLASELGLSKRGAAFLMSKLQRDNKLPKDRS